MKGGKNKKPSILKETKEERAERIRMWRTTTTRSVPDKKHTYNRQNFKKAEVV